MNLRTGVQKPGNSADILCVWSLRKTLSNERNSACNDWQMPKTMLPFRISLQRVGMFIVCNLQPSLIGTSHEGYPCAIDCLLANFVTT